MEEVSGKLASTLQIQLKGYETLLPQLMVVLFGLGGSRRGGRTMNQTQFAVGQRVRNIDRFKPPADVRVGTIGTVLECLPEEMWVQFAGKRVRAFYSAFEPV
jgi:hypothetical protein